MAVALATPFLAVSGAAAATPTVTVTGTVSTACTLPTERVSVASDGSQANGPSDSPDVSDSGSRVVFVSGSSNLDASVSDTGGYQDVFVRDRDSRTTRQVSRTASGGQPSGHSSGGVISPDGTWIGYTSGASNMGPAGSATDGNVNAWFVQTEGSGRELLTTTLAGKSAGNSFSSVDSISDDNRFVAFSSTSNVILTTDAEYPATAAMDAYDVFVRDRVAGTTTLVSVDSSGAEQPGLSVNGQLSGDGRFLAFRSNAELVSGSPDWSVFHRDLAEGKTVLVSSSSTGQPANNWSEVVGVDDSGRYVSFFSTATNLVPSAPASGLYLKDVQTGAVSLLSIDPAGTGSLPASFVADLSDDAAVAVWQTSANGRQPLAIRDRNVGQTRLLDQRHDGTVATASMGGAALTADGAIVAFHSTDPLFVSEDTNGFNDVFVRGTGACQTTTDDRDTDGDGHLDTADNCPAAANPGQEDTDGDGTGDACDSTDNRDTDGDGHLDSADNCPAAANAGQEDTDGDGTGDACDADIDGDGLSNVVEIWLGCDPHKADTDGDGVGDWLEVVLNLTSPVLVDTHADPDEGGDHGYLLRLIGEKCGCVPGGDDDANSNGVHDWVEYWFFGGLYDPAKHGGGSYSSLIDYIWHLCGCGPDEVDGGGIPTMVKRHYGAGGLLWVVRRCGCLPWEDSTSGGGGLRIELRGGLSHPDRDTDGDGIVDVVEILLGCDPTEQDSDGDGMNDRDELLFGSDPTLVDTDGDGMNDKQEYELGCDPRDRDSDGDGLPDGSDPAPRATILTGSCGPAVNQSVVPIGTAVTVSAAFSGHKQGVRTGHIDWHDGTSTSRDGAGTLTGSYTYTAAGVYKVGCRVVDVNGQTQRTESQVVVYDPSGGFVTGGGWIDSPAGAYTPDPELAGPARFGFVSQYKKGAKVPTGQTEFQFSTAGMNFHAGVYEWLVVSANHTKAQYKGSGTINGQGSYGFLMTAYDLGTGQDVDKLRIKIWDQATDKVVYDNRPGQLDTVDSADPQLISRGQVVIHKGK